MKKTLSVILAAVMIFMFVPFFAFAENVNLSNDTMPADYNLTSGNTYITSGENKTLTIPADKTLYVGNNATLIIAEDYTLNILGQVVVLQGGTLELYGKVYNADKISGDGDYIAYVKFPDLYAIGLNGKIEVSYAVSYSGNAYDDLDGSSLSYTPVSADGETIALPLNQYIYIIAHIIEPVEGLDKFDDSLMKVRLNGVEIPYTQGNHHTVLITGGEISYSTWSNDDAFLNTYKIDLPAKEGVTVVGREGETSADGQTVYVKFGKPFSFRVDIDEEYNKSPYEVYIVRGYGWTNMDTDVILADLDPAQPDADGYYTIPEVKSDYTVFVMGVVANSTIDKVSSIFEQVKNIFEMIKKFFTQFLALFGIELG